jgi:hypothetical protein
MDTMRMNQDYSGEGSRNIHLDEEPNIDATRFFFRFRKILMNHYGMGIQLTVNCRLLHKCLLSS